ncbi:RICIN domain-containing protein [Bradyrhizobium sp.]|uniref:RICIN domain-containing protein n=1 Tax=Bradyrhizobium sp. TaxID=376 RepID=UPI003C63B77C
MREHPIKAPLSMRTSVQPVRASILPMVMGIVAALVCNGFPRACAGENASLPKPLESADVHRVLVIPVNLRGRAPVIVDRAQIMQALYGARDSVASRYRSQSYGQLEFAGSDHDIVDPLTLSEPSDFCDGGLGQLAANAQQELQREGISTLPYQHQLFVIPKDAPCWWTGLGDIGGNRVWVKATTAKALQHELGHNLGMNHAMRWRNADGDDSDFMGTGGTGLNAPHVVEMGWLKNYPGKVVELTAAADVTLETLEADPRQSALPKVVIVRPAPGANVYYLSYRASSPTSPLSDEFTRGVNIHIVDQTRHTGGLTYFVTSLSDGAAYSDGPMIVQQLMHRGGDRVSLRISFTGKDQAEPAGPPPAPPGTVQSLASGKCLDLPKGQSADGTRAIQYDCHGGPNQEWKIESAGDAGYRIISRMTGKCIGTDAASAAPGGHVVESPCGGSSLQLWTIEGTRNRSILHNVADRLCLDVPGGSLANGAQPIVWTCNGGTNQTWRYAHLDTP